MTQSLADFEFARALSRADAEGAAPVERVRTLVDIATRVTPRPKSAALTATPEAGAESLLAARDQLLAALERLRELGDAEETARAELDLGLVLHALAGQNQASITEAIAAYHRAASVFSRAAHPAEFAIIHNNLARAYLAIPLADERAKMREALAVESFREALGVVTLIDHPVQYAMLQNNLGNALQYAASGHPVENNLRALEAYGEALKVRTRERAPLEYANTIANKASCLRNLPDDAERPEAGNAARLLESKRLYGEAFALFEELGDSHKAEIVSEAISEVERALVILRAQASTPARDFGVSRL